VVLGIHIHAVLDEHPSEFHISALRHEMQRSRLVPVLGIHIRAVLNENPSEFHMSALRREI